MNSLSPKVSFTAVGNNNESHDVEVINSVHESEVRFDNTHQQPNSSGFVAWVGKLIDYFSGIFGERMTAPQLDAALRKIFLNKNDWEMFDYADQEQASHMKKIHEGKTYVVSAVSHDRPDYNSMESIMTGAQPVAKTLENIQEEYSKGDVKVLIPIAQANNYGPSGVFGMRGHLVLLEADIKDGELTHATLHDSKGGLLDHIYHGADRLNNLLHDKNIKTSADFSLNVEYRGEQSLFNGKDCGRFTAYYAHEITENGTLDNTSRAGARAFFTHHFG